MLQRQEPREKVPKIKTLKSTLALTCGNIRREHKMYTYKEASAPSYQLVSTRRNSPRREAQTIIAPKSYRPTVREQLDSDAFRAGAMIGFIAAAVLFAAVLTVFVLPTMDGAVQAAKAACAAGAFNA